jgi:iron complex outermembrane recepter protein
VIEIPRSISVVTSKEISDRGVDEVGAALRYSAGVFSEPRGIDTTRQSAVVRGFYNRDAHMVYRDGLRGATTALLHPDPDIYGMERIEVLRGPASVLYGQNTPSGMINLVTKRPTEIWFAETEAHGGSFNQRGGKVDFGGPIDAGRQFLFRITGLARDGDAQVDFLKEKRIFAAPAFQWRLNADTNLTILGHYQNDDAHQALALPALGTIFKNPNGKLSTSFFRGEPGFEYDDKETFSGGYFFDKSWNGNIILRHSLRYDRGQLDSVGIGQTGFQANNRVLNRTGFTNFHDVDSVTTDTNLQFKFSVGPTSNTALVGFDYKSGSTSQKSTCCFAVPSLDAFQPVYGQPFTVGPRTLYQTQDSNQSGFYAQEQLKLFDRIVLAVGGRYDWANADSVNKLTSVKTKQRDTEFTLQSGLVYLFDNGIAPYASYATSFEPLAGSSFGGSPFEPTTGTQYEAGIKYQPPGQASLVSLSAFQLTRQNVLTADPVNIGFSVQTGEVRSRGIELEGKIDLLDSLSLVGAYSYTRTKVTKSNGTDLHKQSLNIPDHLASLWANYTITDGKVRGLGFGAGVRYVGTSFGDAANTFGVPDFTLLDAAIRYEVPTGTLKGLRLAVNANNLLDDTYVTSCLNINNCFYGARRIITGSLSYRW